jgi:hypothetical protein
MSESTKFKTAPTVDIINAYATVAYLIFSNKHMTEVIFCIIQCHQAYLCVFTIAASNVWNAVELHN